MPFARRHLALRGPFAALPLVLGLACRDGFVPLVDSHPGSVSCIDQREDMAEEADPDDCNGNGQHDADDIGEGFSPDCNGNGLPDECEVLDDGCVTVGMNDWMEYRAGNLPIILGAPHGGLLMPDELDNVPDADVYVDVYTQELSQAIHDELLAATGKRPHMILLHLGRYKVEANAWTLEEATGGQEEAEQAYLQYHGFIDAAQRAVEAQYGRGLFIDVHGLDESHTVSELGYLIEGDLLAADDIRLDHPSYGDRSSMRAVLRQGHVELSALLRGQGSVGDMLEQAGFACVPSPGQPYPLDEKGQAAGYFEGGYSTWAHSSVEGGTISGLQLETIWKGVRDSENNRRAMGQVLAEGLPEFMDAWMDLSMAASGRVSFASAQAELWEAGQPLDVMLQRYGDLDSELEVALLVEGSAQPGEDLEALPETVLFEAGSDSAVLSLVPLDDQEEEGPELLQLTLLRGADCNLGEVATLEVALADDELQAVSLVLPASAVEGEAFGLEIRRDECREDYSPELAFTSETSALAELAGEPRLPAGERSIVASASSIPDGLTTGVQELTVSLLAGGGEYPATDAQASLQIVDADQDPDLLLWYDGSTEQEELLDISGSGLHGWLLPSSGQGPQVQDGGELCFDGDDDMVLVEGFDLAPDGAATLAFWFSADTGGDGSYDYLWSHGLTDRGPSLNIYLTDEGWLRSALCGADEEPDIYALDVERNLRDFDWHHYALVLEDELATVYLDGELAAQAERCAGGVNLSGERVRLGGRYDTDPERHYDGLLRDLRVFGRALEQDEVEALAED